MEKKPLNEGSMKNLEKGANKPAVNQNVKPIKPPPSPNNNQKSDD